MKEYRFKGSEACLLDALRVRLKLPDDTLQKLLSYGAVVVRSRGKGAWTRVRDGSLQLDPTDELQVAYEPKVLSFQPFVSEGPVWECPQYGIWYKPAGIMAQGTAAGDHCSLMYAIEQAGKTPFLVHRLDRETEGLMIVAYESKAAGILSDMFQKHEIHKTYKAIVSGVKYLPGKEGVFDQALDGKASKTRYQVLQVLEEDRALVKLEPLTGRLHQIRRHLAMNGAGVWGDPKYGKGNKNRDGMKLAAIGLKFQDPWKILSREFNIRASFEPSET